VLGLGETVLFDQLRDDRRKQMGQTMKAFHEGSGIDLELFADPTEGNAVQIVHDGSGGHQLIAIEIFG
jgi:hypothetical protein